MSTPEEHDDQNSTDEPKGQVSEMAVAGTVPAEISAGDSVAGQPDDESGETQEGAQGPNSIPEDETDEHPHTT